MKRGAAALLAALAAVACGGRAPAERVILVTLDTTRADRLGCYGYAAARTTALDAFSKEAALFERAVAPVPVTLPSHASMLTGLYPQGHGIRYNVVYKLPPEATSVAETFKAAGFATAAFPATFVLDRGYGLDQGFDLYESPPKPERPDDPASERKAAAGVDLALDWLAKHAGGRAFLWLHFYDPHWPYVAPFPFSSTFRDRPYDGEIAYMDSEIGRFLSALRSVPDWDRTAVVVAGDHGEGLFEHRERYHSLLAYETTIHAPLLVRLPGRGDGRRIAEPVSLADVAPTLLDLSGLEPATRMDGISLVPAARGARLDRREIYFESVVGALNYGWSTLKGIRAGGWKLIDSREPELFDLGVDPGETNNLAKRESARLEEMRRALGALEERTTAKGTHQAVSPTLDEETLATLASLGYVSGGTAGPTSTEGPSPVSLIDLEVELMAAQGAAVREDWPALERSCRYVLERDPRNRFSLYNLAWALARTERGREAEGFARELVRLYPDAETNHDLLAQIVAALRRFGEARDVLRRGLEVFPESELLRYHELTASFDLGDRSVCGVPMGDAVRQHPKSGRIRVLAARCEAVAGRTDRAIEILREAAGLGFDRFDVVEGSEDFRDVVKRPEFAFLLGRAGAGGASR